jgi:hypothetical protein
MREVLPVSQTFSNAQALLQARPLGERAKFILLSAALVLAILAVYHPVHHYPFLINVDDDNYIFNNPHVLHSLSWTEVEWAFTHSYVRNYDPLTFLAHSLNVQMFQLHSGLHHDVNVLLHALDAVLLFWCLKRSTELIGRSFMVAALFAVHPINVENVAWVAELKTMISATFFFLALGAYVWYAQKPRLHRMAAVAFLYGLGLLAKPQIITLPFVLLLWDYWPLRRMFADNQEIDADGVLRSARFSALVLEKVPLFFIAGVDVLLTLHAEAKDIERYTFVIRLGTAIRSYAVYLGKALWPSNLGFDYPHPGYSLHWAEVWFALLALVAITIAVVAQRRHRYLVVGWFWFLGTMLPTINIVQIDVPAVADRYAYIPFIGIFVMVCWGAVESTRRWRFSRVTLQGASVALLLILSVACSRQVRYWSDTIALFTRSSQVTARNARSELSLGRLLIQDGHVEQGLGHLYKASEYRPGDAGIMMWIASLEQQRGEVTQAIGWYEKALLYSKDQKINAQVLANLGHAYSDLGDTAHALQCYRAAQRLRQDSPYTEPGINHP